MILIKIHDDKISREYELINLHKNILSNSYRVRKCSICKLKCNNVDFAYPKPKFLNTE